MDYQLFKVNFIVFNLNFIAYDSIHYLQIEGKKGKNSQGTSSAFDMKKEILIVSQISEDSLGCWNTKKPLNEKNFALIAQDHEKNVFPNDIKVIFTHLLI